MNKGIFFRIFICVAFLGFCGYSYLDLQNGITELRIKIPELMSEVRRIEEENTHFQYEIECFESPENLMRLAKSSEFAHLRFPICSEVVSLKQADLLKALQPVGTTDHKKKPAITFATRASP